MRMDLKRWLEKYNATSDDKTVYRSDFMSLLESESLEDFLEKESELKIKWTEAMTDYFDNHYRNDILNHAAKFVLEPYGLYNSSSRLTNNISECLNSVIKRFADWPGISMDAIVTSLFFLQRYKYNEIIRGCLLCGDMKLKENYMDFVLDPATVEMPRSVCLPDQIVDMIQGGKLEQTEI